MPLNSLVHSSGLNESLVYGVPMAPMVQTLFATTRSRRISLRQRLAHSRATLSTPHQTLLKAWARSLSDQGQVFLFLPSAARPQAAPYPGSFPVVLFPPLTRHSGRLTPSSTVYPTMLQRNTSSSRPSSSHPSHALSFPLLFHPTTNYQRPRRIQGEAPPVVFTHYPQPLPINQVISRRRLHRV